MRKIYIRFLAALLLVIAAGLLAYSLRNSSFAVLDPTGTIAHQQKRLLVVTTALSLFVVVPVFVMTAYITWKYRADNPKARYTPEWDSSKKAETVWWVVPMIIISILAVITWQSTHALNPSKHIYASSEPLKIQVVALQWKWLFIYPDSNIATVNYVMMPEDRPVEFNITADAPMNSFWIPQLGGQIYAMSGMTTKLNLQADKPGVYRGMSANLSGEGFADMKFDAKAVPEAEFSSWLANTKPGVILNYKDLATPGSKIADTTYLTTDSGLYDRIVKSYAGNSMEHQMKTDEHH